jgi:hypothetical protein
MRSPPHAGDWNRRHAVCRLCGRTRLRPQCATCRCVFNQAMGEEGAAALSDDSLPVYAALNVFSFRRGFKQPERWWYCWCSCRGCMLFRIVFWACYCWVCLCISQTLAAWNIAFVIRSRVSMRQLLRIRSADRRTIVSDYAATAALSTCPSETLTSYGCSFCGNSSMASCLASCRSATVSRFLAVTPRRSRFKHSSIHK